MWSGPPAARLRELPEAERGEFEAWLRGRTIPHLADVPRDGQDAFYLHDYRYWKLHFKRIDSR